MMSNVNVESTTRGEQRTARRESMLGELLVELAHERHRRARRRTRRALTAITVLAVLFGATATIISVRASRSTRATHTDVVRAPHQLPPLPGSHQQQSPTDRADIRAIATDPNVVARYAAAASPRITVFMDDSALLEVLDRDLDLPAGLARIGEHVRLTGLPDRGDGRHGPSFPDTLEPPWHGTTRTGG